jgi:hypothetical protein
VVTDHNVSTDAELIWHVVFDDGDECDLNLAELLPFLLPETHLYPTKSNPNPSLYFLSLREPKTQGGHPPPPRPPPPPKRPG